MVTCFPTSPKKLAITAGIFLSGVALFATGLHLSYVNVAPQRARTIARDNFVRERIRQRQGK